MRHIFVMAVVLVIALLMVGCAGGPSASANRTQNGMVAEDSDNLSADGMATSDQSQSSAPEDNTSSSAVAADSVPEKMTNQTEDQPAVPTGSGGVAVDVGGSIPITPR